MPVQLRKPARPPFAVGDLLMHRYTGNGPFTVVDISTDADNLEGFLVLLRRADGSEFAAYSPHFDRGEVGHIEMTPGKPCKACAARGGLTWLDADGSCRRADRHR